jgi:hypothetical protein
MELKHIPLLLLVAAIHMAIRIAIPAILVIWIFGFGSIAWWILVAIAAFDYAYACIRAWRHPETAMPWYY